MFGASDSYIADKKMLITVTLNHFSTGLGYHFEHGAYYTPFDDPNANKLFDAYKMIPFQPCQLVLELI
ncbi:hypothetical protein Gohar_024779, partial [Gossypium harknessii]|nr:hypothetical protein [Gossypium harknessii]